MLHGTRDFCARIPTPIVGPSNSTLLFWDWWVLMTLVTPLCTSLIQAQPAFPCHSGVTVARRNRHYLASMQPAKIWFSRVKTVLDSIWQQSEPEFVMRRSGVRFISPAPMNTRVCCYENSSKPFFFGYDVTADVRLFTKSSPPFGQKKTQQARPGVGLLLKGPRWKVASS